MPTHALIQSAELPIAVRTKDVKASEGSAVRPGFVLTRSPSGIFVPGDNVGQAKKNQLFAKIAGFVSYKATNDGQVEVSVGGTAPASKPKAAAKSAEKPKTASKKKEAFTTDAPAPAGLLSSAPDKADDLKLVSGVGPVFEKTLNSNGVYLYSQLAAFTDRDVEWLAAQIGSFPDRIARDEWVDQAKDLAEGKPSRLKG
jgi:predicted flap endonuclease-1-like 5' DNA nuclease